MILCAGLGTRLRPLTRHWPKPAIPLLGQPLLRYTLAMIQRAGIVDVGINTHHLPDVMRAVATAECERLGIRLTISHEPVIQGTAGGIRGLKKFLQDETFVVVNGDVLFALELGEVIATHSESRAAATMVLTAMPPDASYGVVEQGADGRIRRIAGPGPMLADTTPWHFTGVHVVSPAIFDFMSSSGEEDINRAVYPKMISKGLVLRGYATDVYWSDVGNPSGYLATQRDLLHGRVPVERFGSSSPFFGMPQNENIWASTTARVESAKVAGPAFFDSRCAVHKDARIGASVYVGVGSRVDARARLDRSCVLEETHIREGEEVVESIAWRSHRIRAKQSVSAPNG